jgi:hypothetical protein
VGGCPAADVARNARLADRAELAASSVMVRVLGSSLNHFVGAGEECRRDREAKRFRVLEIDNHLELCRLQDL